MSIVQGGEAGPKYLVLANQLRRQVKALPPGSSLPVMRQLMADYEVSQATLYEAIGLLEREELVERKRGKGYFVADRRIAPTQPAQILALVPLKASPFHHAFTEALSDQARQHRLQLTFHPCEKPFDPGTMPISGDFNGLLYLHTHRLTAEALVGWSRVNRPLVVLDRNLRGLGVDAVTSNNYRGGQLAAKHLLSLRHRKLAVVHHEPGQPNLDERVAGFVDEAQEAPGTDISILKVEGASPADEEAAVDQLLRDRLRGSRRAFTGLFLLTHTISMTALRTLYQLRVRVPGDLSVVGYDNLHASALLCPPLTTVDQDMDRLAQAACQLLRRRLEGDDSPGAQAVIPPQLVVRESTAGM